jgi:hypothetical protein
MINFKIAIIFAIPAFTAVYLTRAFLIPVIPDQLFAIGFHGYKESGHYAIFAVVMLMASISMIRDKKLAVEERFTIFTILFLSFGGVCSRNGYSRCRWVVFNRSCLDFLAGTPIKRPSLPLFIIAINSLIGFLGDVKLRHRLGIFTLPLPQCPLLEYFFRMWLNRFIDGKTKEKDSAGSFLSWAFTLSSKN